MTRKRRRLWIVVACGIGLGSATALTLSAFSSSLVFFVSPTDLLHKSEDIGRTVRLGGLVANGSVHHADINGHPAVTFAVTDKRNQVTVHYVGILPDLFREGQGVVVQGTMERNGVFQASEVLAKHSADYMPKDVEAELKKSGRWNPNAGPPPAAATWDTMSVKNATKAGG